MSIADDKQAAMDEHDQELQEQWRRENHEDWDERCSYHKPSPEGIKAIEGSRAAVSQLGHVWLEALPECEERERALERLQEALMWANAAAACRMPGGEREGADGD